jgi:lactate permease
MGKMIDAQSIVVASVATSTTQSAVRHAPVSPADVLRYVFLHSLGLAILVGLLVLLQAYVVPWMIP